MTTSTTKSMSAEDLAWVTETLVETERRRCVSRVSSVETEDAVAKGDNFGSDMRRLRLSVVLHSGEIQQRSLIYKALPSNEQRRKYLKKIGVFAKETRVFMDVLSELEVIQKEKEPHCELLWPECFGSKSKNEGILMEDLKVKGFKMANRQTGMDFDHAVMVVQSLAKFHSLAAILREKGDLNIMDFDKPQFTHESHPIDTFYKRALQNLARVLETKWKPEWRQYAERVRELGPTLTPKLLEISKREDEEKFYTLNHGDCWLNNMMFRYGRDEKLEAVRFVDFQLCHYNHPGFDLQHFFQASLNLEARPRKTELLQEYHSSLEENLKFFGYGGVVPTYEEILGYYKSAAYFGLAVGLSALPIMLIPREFTQRVIERKELSLYDYDGEVFIQSMEFVIKEAAENNLI